MQQVYDEQDLIGMSDTLLGNCHTVGTFHGWLRPNCGPRAHLLTALQSPARSTSYSALAFKSCRTNTRAPPRHKSEGSMQNAESWGRISLVLQTAPPRMPIPPPST